MTTGGGGDDWWGLISSLVAPPVLAVPRGPNVTAALHSIIQMNECRQKFSSCHEAWHMQACIPAPQTLAGAGTVGIARHGPAMHEASFLANACTPSLWKSVCPD